MHNGNSCRTHPPRIVELEPRRGNNLVTLAPQKSRQSAVPVHHYRVTLACYIVVNMRRLVCTLCYRSVSPVGVWHVCRVIRTNPIPLINRMSLPLPAILHVSNLRKTSTCDGEHLN